MRDATGTAAAPAARCKKRRRGSFTMSSSKNGCSKNGRPRMVAARASPAEASPALRQRRAHQHFGNARAYAPDGVFGQRVGREKAMGHDLVIGDRRRRLTEGADDEQRHMIAPGYARVEIDGVGRPR